MLNGLLSLPAVVGEWRELGSRDIDHRTRGAKVRAREAIESSLSEFRHDPASLSTDLDLNVFREIRFSLSL
jgi:hypothetical protein